MKQPRKPNEPPKALDELEARVTRPSAAEEALLEGRPIPPGVPAEVADDLEELERPSPPPEAPEEFEQASQASSGDRHGLPPWAADAVPASLVVPVGRVLVVMRFRGEWTDRKDKKDRTCVLWNLSVGDEKIANQKSGDSAVQNTVEKAKRQIRAIDGLVADDTGRLGPANVDQFWDELGLKCRNLITNHFIRAHSLTEAEKHDFLMNCLAARTAYAPRT